MFEPLTRDRFTYQLNTQFWIERGGSDQLPVELVEVSAAQQSHGYESFSIVFRGPTQPLLPQAIYRFRNDAIGSFDLFIVPVRQDQQGLYYEAVFNRAAMAASE